MIRIVHQRRKEGCMMKIIRHFTYGDVDDLIFVNETWSESER